jgi:pimeloyl-ACP methyl ester carboxylesterase
MAPVAEQLAALGGILEPLQTADTVEGQINELCAAIVDNGLIPVILAGFSWGAWLSWMLQQGTPHLVRKLILISSGPFEEKYASAIMPLRLSRLQGKERREALSLIKCMDNPSGSGKDGLLSGLGSLLYKADSYAPLPRDTGAVQTDYAVHRRVWKEAAELRRCGRLLDLAKDIRCPVTAIHGDYDPHPASGVREPLSAVLKDFSFIVLNKCGHYPWLERLARAEFLSVLERECVR